MRLERQHRERGVRAGGMGGSQRGGVAQMHAVEIADGDGGAAGVGGKVVPGVKDAHQKAEGRGARMARVARSRGSGLDAKVVPTVMRGPDAARPFWRVAGPGSTFRVKWPPCARNDEEVLARGDTHLGCVEFRG